MKACSEQHNDCPLGRFGLCFFFFFLRTEAWGTNTSVHLSPYCSWASTRASGSQLAPPYSPSSLLLPPGPSLPKYQSLRYSQPLSPLSRPRDWPCPSPVPLPRKASLYSLKPYFLSCRMKLMSPPPPVIERRPLEGGHMWTPVTLQT